MTPRVPRLDRVRLGVCLCLGLLVLGPLRPPEEPPPAVAIASADGCRLAHAGEGPACECARLSGALRRLLGHPIPLNVASAEDLTALPGIGPARAEAIVESRRRRGPYRALEDLGRVRGIGPTILARIRDSLFVGGPDPACGAT